MQKYIGCLLLLLILPHANADGCMTYNPPSPITGLRLSVALDRKEYEIGDTIGVNVKLTNTATNDIRLPLERRRELAPTCTVRVVVHIDKIGKWVKPRFYDIASPTEPGYWTTLQPGKSLSAKQRDITPHLDGHGVHRVYVTFKGHTSNTVEINVQPKNSQQSPAGGRPRGRT